ncbi:hypothetical protein [Neptunomonas antarctica]|uniref:Uncharacterized protein n=1 Tax=Neptunomonas antarctica TaxID=619304 RepID=A0A1N7MXD9_9GAMM|nr:hypothetical protein [Neptunomonas antarctica]SIS90549.1 hypothetical protein SAMN05421760_10784 [Neptunomonas antarctica]
MSRYNLDEEAAATDRELAGIISKLGVLTDEQISELLPERADQSELNRLIEAVNEAADENRKKAILSERLGTASSVVKDFALALI